MSRQRERVYEIEDIDEEPHVGRGSAAAVAGKPTIVPPPPELQPSILESVRNLLLGRREEHIHDVHGFPHRVRIREVSSQTGKPIVERVREWFVGKQEDREAGAAGPEEEAREAVAAVRGAAGSVSERARAAASAVPSKASEAGASVSSAAQEATGRARRVAEGLVDEAGDAISRITQPVNRAAGSAKSAYRVVTSYVTEAAEEMEDRAEEAVQEAKRRLVEGTEAVAGGARNLVAGRSIGRGGNVAEQAPLTALYTVLGTLVLAWLLTRVWAQRLRTKVFLSDGTLERIREATSSREEAEFVTPSLGPPDEDAISPVSPPPSPRPDRDHPAAVRSAAGVESTKVIYRRHSALSRRIESLGDYAKAFGPMVVLSLFAEASGLNRLVLHILWATWAVAQVLYHQYGIEGSKDSHSTGPGRAPGLYGTVFAMLALAVPVALSAIRNAVKG